MELTPQWRQPNSRGFYGYGSAAKSFQGLSYGDAASDLFTTIKYSIPGYVMPDAAVRAQMAISLTKQQSEDPNNVAIATLARDAQAAVAKDPAATAQAQAILAQMAQAQTLPPVFRTLPGSGDNVVSSVVNAAQGLLNQAGISTGSGIPQGTQYPGTGVGYDAYGMPFKKKLDPKTIMIGGAVAVGVLVLFLSKK